MFAWKDPDAGLQVAVFGSGGGLGRAFVLELARRPGVRRIYAFSRAAAAGGGSTPGVDRVVDVATDILSEAALERAAAGIDDTLDIILVASGMLHTPDIRPERRLRELDPDAMLQVFQVNAVAPTLIAKHFLPKLARGRQTVFAALSARVGSIADNRLGGWLSYRASKAALNMALKTIAIEQARSRSLVVGLHPGTVDTPLSRPFASRVPEGQLFSPERSVRYLLDVIDRLTPEDTGAHFAWDGSRIDC